MKKWQVSINLPVHLRPRAKFFWWSGIQNLANTITWTIDFVSEPSNALIRHMRSQSTALIADPNNNSPVCPSVLGQRHRWKGCRGKTQRGGGRKNKTPCGCCSVNWILYLLSLISLLTILTLPHPSHKVVNNTKLLFEKYFWIPLPVINKET